jgi:hypothetical protein
VLVDIMLDGWTVFAAVLALWSVRVAYDPTTKPAVRAIAYKVFRAALTSGVAGGITMAVRLTELHSLLPPTQ